jgi:hypothetical protein
MMIMNRASQQAERELRRLNRVKQTGAKLGQPLGPEMIAFFKQSVEKRHTKLSKIAEVWSTLIPETLNDHCALESFNRGSLTVVVDSSPHLYELKQLLLAGLQPQILIACKSTALRKISLKLGRWYEGDDAATRKLRFDR